MKGFSTMNDHAIFGFLDLCAHFPKIFRHNLDAVGLFDTKLLCIPDNSGSFCKSCHNGDHWKFIDQSRNDRAFYCGPVKRRGADQKIGSRFALCGFIEESDICSHGPAYTEDAVTGRVDPHIFQKDLTVGNKKTCCDKISCRRDISRNQDLTSVKRWVRFDGCCCSLCGYIGAKVIQHDLRVISGKDRLCYTGNAVRVHSGKKYAGFYLGRCYRRIVVDGMELFSGDLKRCTSVSVETYDIGTHLGKRSHDPFHRAFLDGSIAGKL